MGRDRHATQTSTLPGKLDVAYRLSSDAEKEDDDQSYLDGVEDRDDDIQRCTIGRNALEKQGSKIS